MARPYIQLVRNPPAVEDRASRFDKGCCVETMVRKAPQVSTETR